MPGCGGVPPEYIAWAQLLYADPLVHLYVNGHGSAPIRPDHGVKQGCPLSPLLFVLTIEPLSEILHSQEDLGIQLPDGDWACGSLFADDVMLFSGLRYALEFQLNLVRTV